MHFLIRGGAVICIAIKTKRIQERGITHLMFYFRQDLMEREKQVIQLLQA
ncbi:hypothetical protein OPIT5_16520 [Opitutaceae bacterium TAV5]|nr:hypothetical protein OPIT5_16520 [Opitutaceae bacterium TAV5]